MVAVIESLVGELLYTSDAPERTGQERGRESFRMDIHPMAVESYRHTLRSTMPHRWCATSVYELPLMAGRPIALPEFLSVVRFAVLHGSIWMKLTRSARHQRRLKGVFPKNWRWTARSRHSAIMRSSMMATF